MPDFSDVLLTVDYDRTLTAPDSTIPQRNLDAIRWFMDNGGAFTVNTGRSIPMTKTIQQLVPVNAPLLLYNGSAAFDTKGQKLDFCHEIPMDLWQTIRTCQQILPHMVLEVQGLDAHYCFTENPVWNRFNENNGCPYALAQPGQDLGPFLKFTVYGDFKDEVVSTLFEATPEELARMEQAENLLKQTFGQWVEVFRSGARILDIHARGVSKNRSARELQQRLGRKILVCAGDGENDVPMLTGADYGFCPADAVVADRFEQVCPCAEGAVADVIYKKIPEILK